MLANLLAKLVVIVVILVSILFGQRLGAFGVSSISELDEYAIVIARARAELEILHAASHGPGAGDADDVDALARKRDVAIDRTVRFLRVRIAHQNCDRSPIGRQFAGVQVRWACAAGKNKSAQSTVKAVFFSMKPPFFPATTIPARSEFDSRASQANAEMERGWGILYAQASLIGLERDATVTVFWNAASSGGCHA